MPRNGGAVIDVRAQTVRDRNGVTYPIDALVVGDGALYYARPIEGNRLFSYHERWVLPQHSLALSRFLFHAHRTDAVDWYIETDPCDVAGDVWSVRDGYIDVYVHRGVRYDVEDADELADGIVNNELPLDDAILALHALDFLCRTLRTNGYSGHALLRQFAPSLPESVLIRDEHGTFSRRA